MNRFDGNEKEKLDFLIFWNNSSPRDSTLPVKCKYTGRSIYAEYPWIRFKRIKWETSVHLLLLHLLLLFLSNYVRSILFCQSKDHNVR